MHRLGLFRLAMFFALEPLFDELLGEAARGRLGHAPPRPAVARRDRRAVGRLRDLPGGARFVDYLIHRGQHRLRLVVGLHSLHHSQRQMTMWSDNRNHLLDDMLRDAIIVVVAQLIGVAPGQFIAHRGLHAAQRKPAARQPAAAASARSASGCGSARASTARTTASASATSRDGPRSRSARLQLRRAAAVVGHAASHRQFRRALRPTGIRDQVEPDARAACATTAAASGRSSGWACRRLVGRGLSGRRRAGVILGPDASSPRFLLALRSPTACTRG